jgi:hypothetical protein
MKKDDIRFYVKDLKILEDNYDLKDIVIIDNSVLSFAYHLDNGIPISPFYDSKKDNELLEIADLLVKYADENDIRNILKDVYKLNEFLEILKDDGSEESSESPDNVTEENNIHTTKNVPNKNKTNINLNQQPLINNNGEQKTSGKNCSQTNIKFKEITNLFNDENKEKENEEFHNHTPRIMKEQMNFTKYKNQIMNLEKNIIRSRKKETQIFGINFIKEWEEKQRELKNK